MQISFNHNRILSQLPDGMRAHFPVVLTRKYACDIAVISLLRGRTLGNSPSAFRNNLQEVHSEEWLRKQLVYLQDCRRHQDFCLRFQQEVPAYKEACPFPPFPTPRFIYYCSYFHYKLNTDGSWQLMSGKCGAGSLLFLQHPPPSSDQS